MIRPPKVYCTQAWVPVSRHGNETVILRLEGLQTRVTKVIKRVKADSYRERLDKLELIT